MKSKVHLFVFDAEEGQGAFTPFLVIIFSEIAKSFERQRLKNRIDCSIIQGILQRYLGNISSKEDVDLASLIRFENDMKRQLSFRASIIIMILGLLFFILYLYFFVGFGDILEILSKIDPLEYFMYYSLSIIAIMVSIIFYAMTWHDILKTLSLKLSLKRAILYSWVGNFVDLVLPLETISGELTRLYLIQRDIKGDLGRIVASLVYHRIISISTTLFSLAASSIYLIIAYKIRLDIIIFLLSVLACTTTTIILILYLSLNRKAAERIAYVIIKVASFLIKDQKRLESLKGRIMRELSVFYDAAVVLGKNPWMLAKPLLYSYLSWFSQLTVYLLVFYALGVSWIIYYIPQMIVVFSITLAVQTIPVGFPVGLVELVMTYLYNILLKTSPAMNGLATSLIRIVTFWFQIIVGLIIVQWMGLRHALESEAFMNRKGILE